MTMIIVIIFVWIVDCSISYWDLFFFVESSLAY
jgi:hypothetical protein